MRFAVIGDPVAHSLSPAIHAAALDACGIAGTYDAIRVSDRDGAAAFVDRIRSGEFAGVNVTMPLKRTAAGLADRLSPEAARAGAVNTFVMRERELVGHLTDIAGIRTAWAWNRLPGDAPVAVLGAGGAAAAALVALDDRPVFVAARRPAAARDVLEQTGVVGTTADWGEPLPEGVVVVNATPVGMTGEALPGWALGGCVGLLEMAYAAGPSASFRHVRDRGLPAAPGVDMLLGQAMASFTIWTRRPAPFRAMREAAPIVP